MWMVIYFGLYKTVLCEIININVPYIREFYTWLNEKKEFGPSSFHANQVNMIHIRQV